MAPAGKRHRCRHCKRLWANRPRRLCWGCFYDPAIRARYAPLGERGRHGARSHQSEQGEATLPAAPTAARPGTPEKIEVMRERVGRGEGLFHPSDTRMDRSKSAGRVGAADAAAEINDDHDSEADPP